MGNSNTIWVSYAGYQLPTVTSKLVVQSKYWNYPRKKFEAVQDTRHQFGTVIGDKAGLKDSGNASTW